MNNTNALITVGTTPVSPVSILTTASAPAVILAASYASQVNSKYQNSASHFVNIKNRIDETIAALPYTKQLSARAAINNACTAYIKRFPNKTKFSDLDLCESLLLPMMDIMIDTTMQRMLILSWVTYIVANFRDVQAQPIQVYKIANKQIAADLGYYPIGNDLYASWDAQHTLAALYIIAVLVFKEDPATIMVPVVIYKVSCKADIRDNFVTGNSSAGKKLLDDIDLFQQQVYGVRIDGNNNPDWVEAEQKQQYVEQAGLFVTADKFGDTHMPGAISRMQEIKHYNSDIIRQFCLYAATVQSAAGRPVASQEIEIMCAWFDMARVQGLDYTDAEIVDMAQHIDLTFGADFHEASIFWDKARVAYTNWWNAYYSQLPPAYVPSRMSFSKNWRNGGTFLYHQLLKTWPGRVPKLNIATSFVPDAKDLF
jgi:hypothetical protein